jgi:hypothetical protein
VSHQQFWRQIRLPALRGGESAGQNFWTCTSVGELVIDRVKPFAYGSTAPLTMVTTALSNLISNVSAVLLFRTLVPVFANPQQE